jgi:hypothetical protein
VLQETWARHHHDDAHEEHLQASLCFMKRTSKVEYGSENNQEFSFEFQVAAQTF